MKKFSSNKFPPRSKFESWIRKYGGTKEFAASLAIEQRTVQFWLRKKCKPSIVLALKIIELSKNKVTLKDIVEATS